MIVECGQPRQNQRYEYKHEHTINILFQVSQLLFPIPAHLDLLKLLFITITIFHPSYRSTNLTKSPHAFGDFHVSSFPSNRRLSFLPSLMRSAPPFLSASSLFVSQSSIPHLTRPSFHRSCTCLFFSNPNIGVPFRCCHNLFHCKVVTLSYNLFNCINIP